MRRVDDGDRLFGVEGVGGVARIDTDVGRVRRLARPVSSVRAGPVEGLEWDAVVGGSRSGRGGGRGDARGT